MKLLQLEPQFRRHLAGKAPKSHGQKRADGTMQWGGFDVDFLARTKSFGRAHGISFLCPKCFQTNGGPVRTHQVMVWFSGRGAPDRLLPAPRWGASGTGYADLTLTPSILLLGGCAWHGWITRGDVISC